MTANTLIFPINQKHVLLSQTLPYRKNCLEWIVSFYLYRFIYFWSLLIGVLILYLMRSWLCCITVLVYGLPSLLLREVKYIYMYVGWCWEDGCNWMVCADSVVLHHHGFHNLARRNETSRSIPIRRWTIGLHCSHRSALVVVLVTDDRRHFNAIHRFGQD